MRKIPAALATLGLVTLGLAGCSATGVSACVPAAADPDLAALVTVDGADGAKPTVDLKTPFNAADASFTVTEEGTGTQIVSDDQLVVVDVTVFSGKTGEPLQSTAYSGQLDQVGALSQWTTPFPSWEAALQCASAGSQVVVAMAPSEDDDDETGLAPDVAASLGLAEGETGVAVIDVRKVYLSKADGANQFNSNWGMPTVVRAPDGRPGITLPGGAAPTEQVVQVIKKGDGAKVDGENPVRVAYTGATWDGKETDSTWGKTPASVEVGSDPAFDAALKGQTVGSQVMVVSPADENAPAHVLVVDILGLDGVAG